MKNKNFSAALIHRPLALGVSGALMLMLASCGGSHGDSNSPSSNATHESPQQEAYEVPEDDPTPDPLNIVPVPETGLLAKQSVQEQAQALAVVAADSEAHVKGQFGPMHKWPTMPIAMAVLPDGRVLAYGSNEKGQQNAKIYYVVWDPKLGTGEDAFLKLPNTTDTDIFCTGQALLPSTGGVLIFGGDLTVNGKRNYGDNDMTIFDPATTKLTSADANGKALPKMNFKRWYASGISLPNGEYVALGGRNDMERKDIIPNNPATYSPTPELRLANGTWRKLTTATSDLAYGATNRSWFYPRAWAHPKGGVFIIAHQGQMFNLNTSGTGALNQYSGKLIPSAPSRPSVMFAPGRILTLRGSKVANVIDINNGAPVVSSAGTLAKDRQFANATVLADGRVWVNGGSSTGNDLVGKALDSEIWNPATNTWTTAASATQARLYHSASILLPDGRVLTGGGGANGP